MFFGNKRNDQDKKRSQSVGGVDRANEDDVYVGAYGTFEGILSLRRQLRQTQSIRSGGNGVKPFFSP